MIKLFKHARPNLVGSGALTACALLVMPMLAEAGQSQNSMTVRVEVVKACDLGAAVSADGVVCSGSSGAELSNDTNDPQSSSASALTIDDNDADRVRTIIF